MARATFDTAVRPAQPRHRQKKFFAKLLLVIFGFAIGVTVAEIALRIADYSYPEFYQLDQTRGYALRPNVEGWYRKEGRAYIRVNSDGMRDREHPKAKPADTVRIAILGDSYSEARQLPMEQTYWAVLEKKLQECNPFGGKKIEVLNFGVGGYGTAHELLTLRDRVWNYSPDIVLLAVTTSNDVSDNSLQLRQRVQAPYFYYQDGKLLLDNSFRNSKGFKARQWKITQVGSWIYDRSRVLQAIAEGLRGIRILALTWRSRRNSADHSQSGNNQKANNSIAPSPELGTDVMVYREPKDPVWIDAWSVTEGLMLMLRDEIRDHGAKLLVVTLSNEPQVLPDPQSRQLFMKQFAIEDLFYPDKRIKSLCEREDIPVITLAPELQRYAEEHKVMLHGFGKELGNGHWNENGHRIAGELITDKICKGMVFK